MKKPDEKQCMISVCKSCRKEMPIDKEKSNSKEQYYKRQCICGGTGVMKFTG